LSSGLNRGNGIWATYEVLGGVGVGLTFNAGSPITSTASPLIGGTYSPYPNFYGGILKALSDDPYRQPPENQHFMLVAPSLAYRNEWIEAHVSVQIFRVDISTASEEDDLLQGTNVRAGVKLRLLGGALVPFLNFSRAANNVVGGANSPKTLPGQDWEGMTLGGGLDWNISGNNGIGAQYMLVTGAQGASGSCLAGADPACVYEHYVNVGGTYWLAPGTSVGARVGFYRYAADDRALGDISYFLTVRTML
jgi:hypothetical protein